MASGRFPVPTNTLELTSANTAVPPTPTPANTPIRPASTDDGTEYIHVVMPMFVQW